jgi:transposase
MAKSVHTGPKGLSMLVVRTWMCHACGGTHDRDVNAARNILSAGRCAPSVSGNELSIAVAEPSQIYGRCEAGKSTLRLAA